MRLARAADARAGGAGRAAAHPSPRCRGGPAAGPGSSPASWLANKTPDDVALDPEGPGARRRGEHGQSWACAAIVPPAARSRSTTCCPTRGSRGVTRPCWMHSRHICARRDELRITLYQHAPRIASIAGWGTSMRRSPMSRRGSRLVECSRTFRHPRTMRRRSPIPLPNEGRRAPTEIRHARTWKARPPIHRLRPKHPRRRRAIPPGKVDIDAVVFSGGGARCFWQAGFWQAVTDRAAAPGRGRGGHRRSTAVWSRTFPCPPSRSAGARWCCFRTTGGTSRAVAASSTPARRSRCRSGPGTSRPPTRWSRRSSSVAATARGFSVDTGPRQPPDTADFIA